VSAPPGVLTAPRRPLVDRDTVATALGLGGLTMATWPVVVAAAGPGAPLTGVVAHVAGMLAGYLSLVLLVLVARTPTLERGVGADVLARWHARTGRATLVLVLLHGWAAIATWAQARGEGWLGAAGEVLGMPALPAAGLSTPTPSTSTVAAYMKGASA